MLTFNINFDVHAVSVGPLVVDILVDLDGRHVGVLDVEGRALRLERVEAGGFPGVELFRLEVVIAQHLEEREVSVRLLLCKEGGRTAKLRGCHFLIFPTTKPKCHKGDSRRLS